MFLSRIAGTKRWVVVAIIALVLVLLLGMIWICVTAFAPHPSFDEGTRWVCSNPSISVVVDADGVPRGNINIDGKEAELTIYTRARVVFFHLWDGTPEETLFLTGHCRVDKDRMVITNISYVEEYSVFSVK